MANIMTPIAAGRLLESIIPARLFPLWQIGTGIGERIVQVHNPRYYSTATRWRSASYWVMLAEQQLSASGSRPPT